MSDNPYKTGKKSYTNGNWINPYRGEGHREDWQRGFDEAQAASYAEQATAQHRRDGLWNVPERARDEYIAMEDQFCPETVLDFMKAMLPAEESP